MLKPETDQRAPGTAARGVRRSGDSERDTPELPVLLVHDATLVARMVSRQIEQGLNVPVRVAHTLPEATEILRSGAAFHGAVVDLDLPEASPGAVVDLTIAANLPTLVLTGACDGATRERILEKDIVDYFLKEEQGITGVIRVLLRLHRNPRTRILVVDDSRTYRMMVRRLLAVHRFDVVEAEDGEQGLATIRTDPSIRLVLTDYEMPRMNGVEMVQQIRPLRARDELAIIGLSAVGSSALSALFLKHGADDFLNKPFEKEEFYCRVYRSVEAVEHVQAIKRAAFTDQLTGLANRLHFFSRAPALYADARAANQTVTAAMIDIDHFKAINDTYGHAGGDEALRHLAALLTAELRDLDVLARFGGEEFCVLTRGLDAGRAPLVFGALREKVAASTVEFEGQQIRFTLSVGVTQQPDATLDQMINRADRLLYDAKESGRNRVVFEP